MICVRKHVIAENSSLKTVLLFFVSVSDCIYKLTNFNFYFIFRVFSNERWFAVCEIITLFLRNSFCQVGPSSGNSIRDNSIREKKAHIIIQFSKYLEYIQVDDLKGRKGKTSHENISLLMFWCSNDTVSPNLEF